jgi:hypothetical protein
MGANAQTAVPVFTAGQVLTAAQQTQINTGIPVFATTVTRDAAFGGAGEKTLAQGQFAFIEATNTLQVYDGTGWRNRQAIVQIVTGTTSTAVTNATASFVDTGLTATITPTSASNKILVLFNLGTTSRSNTAGVILEAKFLRDATSLGLQQNMYIGTGTDAALVGPQFTVYDNPATTSAVIYKAQFRLTAAAGNCTVQAASMPSNIILIEVSA